MDSKEVLSYLSELNSKVNTLKFISSHLEGSKVEIFATFKDDNTTVVIDQELIPYNLAQELKIIIGDSIDEYQRIIVNLSTTL